MRLFNGWPTLVAETDGTLKCSWMGKLRTRQDDAIKMQLAGDKFPEGPIPPSNIGTFKLMVSVLLFQRYLLSADSWGFVFHAFAYFAEIMRFRTAAFNTKIK